MNNAFPKPNTSSAALLFASTACLMLTFASACGGDNHTSQYVPPSSAFTAFTDAARACQVLSTGTLGFRSDANLGPLRVCRMNCIAAQPCAQLVRVACEYDPADPCFDACQARIDCGDGTTVGADTRCNGTADCVGGVDEAGCSTFACGDGSSIATYLRCDGNSDCLDGTDELSCPEFTCSPGVVVTGDVRCDGDMQCANGADEAGCATFACADGSTVVADRECDLQIDCADGSDEHAGCASIDPNQCPL